jgi:membrane protease YdiL (CAAX protease family)
MFKSQVSITPYRSWETALVLFVLIAVVHFTAAFFKSMPLNLIGMSLYAFVSLISVKRSSWGEMRVRKPSHPRYILRGSLLAVLLVFVSSASLYLTVGLGTSNYLVIMAKQQMSYGVITKYNAWQYFPVAVIGLCTISPLAEEIFFRGFFLKTLEYRFSVWMANVLQSILFGFIHLAYLWLTEFNLALIFTMIPLVAFAGILYGWVAQRTGSVFSAMVVHAFYNLLLMLLVYGFIIPSIS